jgi:deazaflavin-dependent oxidoreductase (nitroreductase family)
MTAASTTAKRPGRFNRWLQHTANGRTVRKIRDKGGPMMGMELLVLHTTGRVSGEPRQNPLAWVQDPDGWIVVASGGGERHPDWFDNLLARPDDAAVEVHGAAPVPVAPQVLDGAARDEAWTRLAAGISSLAKHQAKTDRTYPVVRLARR